MKDKFIIVLLMGLCLTSMLTSCGNKNSEANSNQQSELLDEDNSAAMTKINTNDEIKSKLTLPTNNAIDINNKINSLEKKHVSKINYNFLGCSTSINMDSQWKLTTKGEKEKDWRVNINTYPAVMQYADTKNTLTVTVENECEDKDSFLAETQESYLKSYSGEFDSININHFEQLTIDEKDSFKITADVVIGEENYEMTHIISNDVSGKTFSWMFLDNDGSINEFDLANTIYYAKKIEVDSLRERAKFDLDSDDFYYWDNEKKEAVKKEN